jgi:transposase
MENLDGLNKSELLQLLLDKDKLIQDNETLILEKDIIISEFEKIIELLKEQLGLKLAEAFGTSSEKSKDTDANDVNANLFDEAGESIDPNDTDEDALGTVTVKSHARKKPGRKKGLPPYLPVTTVEYDITEEEKTCSCGCTLTQIGNEPYDQLEIIPAQIFILRNIKKKYACKGCELNMKLAKMPPQPIPKSIVGPGLLSYIIISKYEDHLPLYRQEKIFNRFDIDISRSSLSTWVIKAATLLEPLYDLMSKDLFNCDTAFADETVIQVLKELDRAPEKKSYVWLFIGGDPLKRPSIYHYNQSRSHEVPLIFLDKFSGYLHCDGYKGYEALANKLDIKLVGCWAHCRRKFTDVQKVTKKKTGISGKALDLINKLFNIERQAQKDNATISEILSLRKEKSLPILKQFELFIDESRPNTPKDSLLGKALTYATNQREKLKRYLEDGRLEISNNRAERKIKPFTIGRKNWLFCNSPAGAKAGAILYSFIETCKDYEIKPYEWFRYVFSNVEKLNDPPAMKSLLPYYIDKKLLKIKTAEFDK